MTPRWRINGRSVANGRERARKKDSQKKRTKKICPRVWPLLTRRQFLQRLAVRWRASSLRSLHLFPPSLCPPLAIFLFVRPRLFSLTPSRQPALIKLIPCLILSVIAILETSKRLKERARHVVSPFIFVPVFRFFFFNSFFFFMILCAGSHSPFSLDDRSKARKMKMFLSLPSRFPNIDAITKTKLFPSPRETQNLHFSLSIPPPPSPHRPLRTFFELT